jgi:hypothetical protein
VEFKAEADRKMLGVALINFETTCGDRWRNGLRRQADFECSGPNCPDPSDILDLMRADLPRLNEARAAVMGAPQG